MTIRVVCVGAGWVTANRHIPSLLRDRRVQLCGIIDRHPDRAATLAARHRLPHGTSLDEPWLRDIQAMTIGTPPPSHAELALLGLQHGWHVLTEKPFAMSVEEAEQMRNAARRYQRVLAVVHNFQFARSIARARELLARGVIGELRSAFGLQFSNARRRLPSWYVSLPLGLFYDEAPHLCYLLRSFIGETSFDSVRVVPSLGGLDQTPRIVSAVAARVAPIGALEMFFDAAVSEWQFMLLGSEGTLVGDIFRDILIRLPQDGRHDPRDILRTSAYAIAGHLTGTLRSGLLHLRSALDYGNDEVVRRFVDAIESGRTPEGISADDGVAVIRMLSQVVAAA